MLFREIRINGALFIRQPVRNIVCIPPNWSSLVLLSQNEPTQSGKSEQKPWTGEEFTVWFWGSQQPGTLKRKPFSDITYSKTLQKAGKKEPRRLTQLHKEQRWAAARWCRFPSQEQEAGCKAPSGVLSSCPHAESPPYCFSSYIWLSGYFTFFFPLLILFCIPMRGESNPERASQLFEAHYLISSF